MGKLEDVLSNTVRGGIVGAASVVDPLGAVIAGADYSLAGAGPSDRARGNDTLYNLVYKDVYRDYEKPQDLGTGYLPRFLGNLAGGFTALGVGYWLWTAVNPVAALAIPITAGVYSLVKGGARYISDFTRGERINNRYEKGSFWNGLKFGWHVETSWLASIAQSLESSITGRGYDTSHIRGSTATHAANASRRNFASMAGAFTGRLAGGVVSALSYFIVPLYKTVRDTIRSVEGRGPGETYSPKYVTPVTT